MNDRTRTGFRRNPPCPVCGAQLRVKPAKRTVMVQMWQCAACLRAGKAAEECQWTNVSLMLAQGEDD
jgi:ribosomal protein L37AE/L43A